MNHPSSMHLRPVCAAIGLLLCMGTPLVQAQDVTTLKPVTITDKRGPDVSLDQVAGEALQSAQAKDMREALQSVNGVDVGGGGASIAQKMYVRGLEDTLVNVTVDGAVLGGNIYHHQSRVQIDPFLVRSIEVEKGTASASAGPGALAGAMRIVTKDATDFLKPGQAAGATVGMGYASNRGSQGSLTAYGQFGGQVDALISVSRQDNSDYQDGTGAVVGTSASTQKPDAVKLNWKMAPGHALTFGFNGTEDTGMRFLRPNMVVFPPQNSTLLPSKLERDTYTLGYKFKGDGLVRTADITVYDDQNKNSRTLAARTYGELIKGQGMEARLESRMGAHTLRYGINHQKLDAAAFNTARVFNAAFVNGATNSGKESSDVTGVFVEDEVSLADRWRLSVGARYDSYNYSDNHGQTFSSNGFSPSAGLQFAATEALMLRASYAQALRGVGLKETFLLDNGPGPYVYRNDANLRPEKAHNVELGLDYNVGTWNLSAEVFSQSIHNYIDTYFGGGQARRINAGKVTSRGYELGLGNTWGNTRARVSLAQSRPELNDVALSDDNPNLGKTSGRTLTLRVDHKLPAYNLDIGWASRFVGSLNYLPAGTATVATKAGYAVHDLYVNWLPTGKDNFRLSLAIRNLFDKFYYDQATYAYGTAQGKILGFAEPGRDVRVEARWSF